MGEYSNKANKTKLIDDVQNTNDYYQLFNGVGWIEPGFC